MLITTASPYPLTMSNDMTYELAKQLKDSGFPQEDKHWYWCTFTFPETLWCINALEKKGLDKEYECMTAAPTLTELIDACGDKFKSLETDSGNWWYAGAGDWLNPVSRIREYSEGGPTREEAVAKLYIALNK